MTVPAYEKGNQARVLALLESRGPLTAREIADLLRDYILTTALASAHCFMLIKRGKAEIAERGRPGRGGRAQRYRACRLQETT